MSTDFNSIDRLVEFGMGLSLAQQMVNTMNTTMSNMRVPGVNAGVIADLTQSSAQAGSTSRQWFAVVEGRQAGPLTVSEIEQLVKRRLILENTLLWTAGLSGWQRACEIPEINKYFLLNR